MAIAKTGITRAGGLAAVAGGLLRIAASFAPAAIASESGRELLYVAVDISLVAGLLAFYASQRRYLRWSGALGFAAALIGFGVIRASRAISSIDLYPIGSTAIVCGLIVLTIVSWSTQHSSGWLPLAFTASLVLGIIGNVVPRASVLFVTSGVVFGIAFAGVGWALWSDARPIDDVRHGRLHREENPQRPAQHRIRR